MLAGFFAETVTSTPIDSSAWAPVISAITSQISVQTIVGVLATVAAAGVGLVFMWWGVRYAIRKLMKNAKTGRM